MKKILLISLALLFSTKVFSQEWTYTYEYNKSSDSIIQNTCEEAYEMSDGRILVSGLTKFKDNCGRFHSINASIIALDANGVMQHHASYLRKGYTGCSPYILENEQGETYILHQFNPDHDTCSPNYFKNFDPPIDHSTLALSKLNDDLSIALSYEWDIPIDTFELDTTFSVRYGEISLFSAMVDSDGYIVGGYTKTVSKDVEPRGKDSTFFFKMDFEGNMVKWVGYETYHSAFYPESYYRFYHLVEADDRYLYYGWSGEVVDTDKRNLVYFDKDFNVIKTGRYIHSGTLSGIQGGQDFFYDQNVIRSPFGTTYMSCLANEITNGANYYCCILYEFDDGVVTSPPIVPIKRFIERKTRAWDRVPLRKGVDVASDNSLYFAYSMRVGPTLNLDSWIMIEHLTPEFDTIATVFYDLPGERMHCEAFGIKASRDGGALLGLWGYDMDHPNTRYESVVKFPSEAFWGVNEAHDNGLKLAVAYPNPGCSTLNICTGLPNAHIEVYDALGRLIHEQEITENETAINAESWPSGLYVWKIYSKNKEAETGSWLKE